MRLLAIALLCCATAAQAQAPSTGTTGPGPGLPSVQPATPNTAIPAARRSRTLEDRFAEANTTHDGHLTAEQARAHMPAVAHHFDEIDTTHQGYVTVDQITDYRRAQRAERRAAKKAARRSERPMTDFVIEAGTPEAVAFRLMQSILAVQPGPHGKEEILKLYAECLATVRGPVAEDLLAALNFDEG